MIFKNRELEDKVKALECRFEGLYHAVVRLERQQVLNTRFHRVFKYLIQDVIIQIKNKPYDEVTEEELEILELIKED